MPKKTNKQRGQERRDRIIATDFRDLPAIIQETGLIAWTSQLNRDLDRMQNVGTKGAQLDGETKMLYGNRRLGGGANSLSHAATRIHITFPKGAWHKKGVGHRGHDPDIHILHITDRSKCDADMKKKCEDKAAFFWDCDKQAWVEYCPNTADKHTGHLTVKRTNCNVGTAADYAVGGPRPSDDGTDPEVVNLWNKIKKKFEWKTLLDSAVDIHQYNQYQEYDEYELPQFNGFHESHEYPQFNDKINDQAVSLYGYNNNMDYTLITSSALILGLISLCLIIVLSCIAGAVFGSLITYFVSNKKNKNESNENENDQVV